MSGYTPTVGDRIRATTVHEGVVTFASDSGHFTLRHDDGTCTTGCVSGQTTVELLPPVEDWQPGDVVRNADDPEDKRIWVNDDPAAPDLWFGAVHPRGGWRWAREKMPANLRLLVRDGQPVTQSQSEPAHPQPGDVVAEEPPVGSVVRDREHDLWARSGLGWSCGQSERPIPWTNLMTAWRPLELVCRGAGQ